MIHSKLKATFLISALICTSGLAQNIDSLVKLRVDLGETPGIVVGIYAKGKTTYYQHGFANVETKEKAGPKTLFEIGSITKTFTTLATARMIENGQWHNGGTGGFRTFAGFDPQTQTGVVVLTNSNTGADDLGFYLLDHSLPLKSIRRSTSVDEKILKEYVGLYEMTPSFSIAITFANGSLFLQATGQGQFELFSESEKKFFLKVVDAQIEFVRGENGPVEKLLLYQGGAIQPAKKVK